VRNQLHAVWTSEAEPGAGASVALTDRVAWRDAALAWLGQHAFFFAISYLAATLIRIPSYSSQTFSWTFLFQQWWGFDGANYAVIAQKGYYQSWMAAFFPLLSGLEHVLAGLFGAGSERTGGMLVSGAASLGAFGGLRVLVEREYGRGTARRSLLYLAVFPTAFFLAAPYAEALLLLFSVGTFLALRRGHWVIAGVLAALATLSRPQGILLIVPIAAEWVLRARADASWRRPVEAAKVAAGVALPGVTLAAYVIYLHVRFGTWSAIADAQRTAASAASTGLCWASRGRPRRWWTTAPIRASFRCTSCSTPRSRSPSSHSPF
jgi:Gpi18-like mannosyltransferase